MFIYLLTLHYELPQKERSLSQPRNGENCSSNRLHTMLLLPQMTHFC